MADAPDLANLPGIDQFPMWAELYVEHECEAIALSWYDARPADRHGIRARQPVAPTTPADLRTTQDRAALPHLGPAARQRATHSSPAPRRPQRNPRTAPGHRPVAPSTPADLRTA
ncbi:hypothetical protein [Streptomyces canus]|uniref:hypothetical protein n=1 Tax=Streptomyces canus TaxID=58343 RepID=UPI00099EAA5E